jgi:hypothetical protein
MQIRDENRGERQAEALKAWATFFNGLSQRMTDDYWAHANAFGRYVDDLSRVRSLATFEEVRRAYQQRVLAVLEHSAQAYAALFERRTKTHTLTDDRAVDTPKTVHAPEKVDAPKTVEAPEPKATEVAPVKVTQRSESAANDSARAKAAADALLNVVRARAEAEKTRVAAAVPAKRPRVRKAASKAAKTRDSSATTAEGTSKPRKSTRRPKPPPEDKPIE